MYQYREGPQGDSLPEPPFAHKAPDTAERAPATGEQVPEAVVPVGPHTPRRRARPAPQRRSPVPGPQPGRSPRVQLSRDGAPVGLDLP